jgi:tRNA pseudouridine32 synthase/23S rRNA pseudouridine746 synthase
MSKIIEQKILIKNNTQTLIDALNDHTELSKQTLKSALDKGCIWLKRGNKTQRVRRIKKPLKPHDEVYIYYNETVLNTQTNAPELLLDKQIYSVWFKPAGVFSQGSKWGDHCALTRLSEKALSRESFLVHRLDRATSGLMILAHNKPMARYFSELFAQRAIQKTYLATICGKIDGTTILNTKIDGKHAVSHIKHLAFENGHSLLEVTIETGRKHQIRKHLSEAGFAIVGDRLYGKKHTLDLQLQAVELRFICPITQEELILKLPDFQKIHLTHVF